MTTEPITQERLVRQATRDDLAFVAWCNYEATSPYPGFCYWDPLIEGLGVETMAFIEAIFYEDALAWGRVEDFFIVEADGRPIGGASGFEMPTDDYRPLRLDRLPLVAQRLGWDEDALSQFTERYQQVWGDPHDLTIAPSAPWVIECVAVLPEARGRGVAKQVVRAALEEGKRRGFTHASISVTNGNDTAQRAYESVGFRLYMMYGADYFDDAFPGTTKYRIRLTTDVPASDWNAS